MERRVEARLNVWIDQPARLAIQIAVANSDQLSVEETLTMTVAGQALPWDEIVASLGGRVWLVDAPIGRLSVHYNAAIGGQADPPDVDAAAQLLYLRPSRYCESDRMIGFASRLFRNVDSPTEVLAAVSSWVGTQLEYVSGSSGPTDGAVDTLLTARGVCRDFAHLAVTLLRAKGVPARLVAVYAPGLDPMDFHAVAEAFVEGAWYVVDATLLAPRKSLVRIATGRDAADTSFLSNSSGSIMLEDLQVTATIDGPLPVEDVTELVQLR